MYNVRESWTDERLDDFRAEVNRRFNEVDRRFDQVDQRFDSVESELQRVNDRFDGMHRTMIHGFVAMIGAIVAGNAALIGLVATQL
jgi:tetrahydromethanopterin S-methyltransferase subunit G